MAARKIMGKSTETKPNQPSRFDGIDMKGDANEAPVVSTEATEIVCVIDRSGSMDSIKEDAIGGFNSFLEEQQGEPGEATMTIILFDDKYDVIENGTPIKEVKPLTRSTFVPRGSTALNDAIGKAISALKSRNPKNAIITVLTDGKENASVEYSKQQIKDMMKECTDKGWFVAYLSANMDAFEDAKSVGIGRAQTSTFSADSRGLRVANLTASYATSDYRNRSRLGQPMSAMSSMAVYGAQASQNYNSNDNSNPFTSLPKISSALSSTNQKKPRRKMFR
jgi:hypothetical protein